MNSQHVCRARRVWIRSSAVAHRRVLLLAGIAALALFVRADSQTLDDPLPIRRKLLNEKQLRAELQRIKSGKLVQMPRQDFEAEVQRTAATRNAKNNPPRLVKAYYSASLKGDSLVDGRGSWTVINNSKAPGFLPLAKFNLALSNIQIDGNDAVIGEIRPGRFGLIVTDGKRRSYFFDWSLRGVATPQGPHFTLLLPSCASSTLELTLPTNYVIQPSAAIEAVSTHPAANPKQRIWRMHFTQMNQIDLTIRKSAGPKDRPLILAYCRSAYELKSIHFWANYKLDLEVLRFPVRELNLQLDPSLNPISLSAPRHPIVQSNISPIKDGAGRLIGKRLQVVFQNPIQGRLPNFQIKCFGNYGSQGKWNAPAIHVSNAITHQETIDLETTDGVRLDRWSDGAFRIIHYDSISDGSEKVTLVGPHTAKLPQRPSGVVAGAPGLLQVTQDAWWRLKPHESVYDATLRFSPSSGRRTQIVLRVPPEKKWKLDTLDWQPKNEMTGWNRMGDLLTIDLQPGLTSRYSGVLKLRFRTTTDEKNSATVDARAFPFVKPLSASVHRTALAITIDPVFQSALQIAPTPAVTPDEGPWKSDGPDYYFVFRNEDVRGRLLLKSSRNRLRARVRHNVHLTPGIIRVGVEMELQPLLGNPDHVDIFLINAPPEPVQWKSTVPISEQKRLFIKECLPYFLHLGALAELETALLKTVLPAGQCWRVTFKQPLASNEKALLKTEIAVPRRSFPESDEIRKVAAIADGAQFWPVLLSTVVRSSHVSKDEQTAAVPLVTLLDVDRLQGSIAVSARDIDAQWLSIGTSTPDNRTAKSSAQSERKAFRFGDGVTHRFPQLFASIGKEQSTATQKTGAFPVADLTTLVAPGRSLVHHFRFAVRDWTGVVVPVRLPSQMSHLIGIKTGGIWLEQFPHHRTSTGWRVDLPVLERRPTQEFEILYTSRNPWRGERLWATFNVPRPYLPLPIQSFTSRLKLAPGLTPLDAGVRYQPDGPQKNSGATLPDFWRQGNRFVQDVLSEFSPHATANTESEVALAAKQLALDKGVWTLGDAVHQLYLRQVSAQSSLVIDTLAFKNAKIHNQLELQDADSASQPFWIGFSISVVPNSVAPFMSTPPFFSTPNEFDEAHAAWLRKQLLDAVYQGSNATGRFVRADVWAKQQQSQQTRQPTDLPSLLSTVLSDPLAQDWSEWVSHTKYSAGEPVVIVNRTGFDRIGKLIALLIVVVIWRARRFFAGRLGRWFALFAVLAFGVAWFALPIGVRPVVVWPLVLTCAMWFVWAFVKTVQRSQGSQTSAKPMAAASALLILITWATSPYAGDTPQSYTVYLLGDAQNPAKQKLLAPPSLLDAMAKMRRDLSAHGEDAVLIGAEYKAQVADDFVSIKAVFECFSFNDKATLHIPLHGVQLEEGAFLNGAPVFPTALPAPQLGYSVPIGAKGFRQLTLSFRAPIKKSRYHSEFECTIPKLAVNNLDLQFANNPGEVFVLDSLGSQNRSGTSVVANLGRRNALHVRWHSAAPSKTISADLTREIYYWDYTLTHPVVKSILEMDVSVGELRKLSVLIPDMAVRQVTAYEVTKQGLERVTKSWRSFGGRMSKRLLIQLARPVAGRLQVRIDASPLSPAGTGSLALRLPRLLQFKSTPKTARVLAYRIGGFDVREESNNLAVTKQTAEKFRTVAEQSGLRIASTPSQVYNFSRRANLAGLNLQLTPPKCDARHDMEWTFGATHADLVASAKCAALLPNHLPLVWSIPGNIVVLDVVDSDDKAVPKWTRVGSNLRAWVSPSLRKTTIRVRGWMKTGNLASGKRTTNLPVVRLLSPQPSAQNLRIREAHGLRVRLSNRKSLKSIATNEFAIVNPNYKALVHIQTEPVPPIVDLRSMIKANADAVNWECLLHYRVRSGRKLALSIQHALHPYGKVAVEAPPGFRVSLIPGKDMIQVICPENHPNRFVVKLSGTTIRKALQNYPIPKVTPIEATVESHLLASTGVGLTATSTDGLKPIPFQASLFAGSVTDDTEEDATRKAWTVEKSKWQAIFQLAPVPSIAKARPLVIYQRNVLESRKGWRCTATMKVFALNKSQMSILLPKSASDVSVEVDGRPYSSITRDGRTVVAVQAANPVREVVLHWRIPYDNKPGADWKIEPLRVSRFESTPVFGEVVLPRSHRARQSTDAVTSLHAHWILQNAQAEFTICRLIHTETKVKSSNQKQQFHAAQVGLQHALSHLNLLLKLPDVSWTEKDRSDLETSLNKIRNENVTLLKNPEWRKLSIRTTSAVSRRDWASPRAADDFVSSDRVYYWAADGRTANVPIPAEHEVAQATRHKRTAAIVWCLFMIAIALPMLAPSIFPRLYKVWPDLIWAAALLGCFLFGVSVIGVLLFVYGAAARMFLIIGMIYRRLRRRQSSMRIAATLQ